MKKMNEEKKLIFKKIYANLPSKIREEDIIAVIDEKPFTWNAAYFEINNNTKDGIKILNMLEEMEII
jgi:hypothetical protein